MLKKQREKLEMIKIILETNTVTPSPLSRIATSTIITTTTERVTEPKESHKLFTHPVRHVARQTTPQRTAIMEPMQPIGRLPGREDRKDKIRSKKEPTKKTQMKLLRLQRPKFKLNMPRLHSGAAIDRPEATHLTLPPIPEVVWQQSQETYLTKTHKELTNETQKDTYTPEQRIDVEAKTSPIKETSSQVSGSHTESLLENQTRSIPVQ